MDTAHKKAGYIDHYSPEKARANLRIASAAYNFLDMAEWSLLTLDGPWFRTTAMFQTLMASVHSKVVIVEKDEQTVLAQKANGCYAKIVSGTLSQFIRSEEFAMLDPSIVNLDAMCGWLGSRSNSPLQDICDILERTKRDRLVLATTFSVRTRTKDTDYSKRVTQVAAKLFRKPGMTISRVGMSVIEKCILPYYGWKVVGKDAETYSRGDTGQQMSSTCYRLERRSDGNQNVRWLYIDGHLPGFPVNGLAEYQLDRIRYSDRETATKREKISQPKAHTMKLRAK